MLKAEFSCAHLRQAPRSGAVGEPSLRNMVNVSWAVAGGGGVHAATEARGSEALMTFDSASPAIRTAAPSLPFTDAPGGADSCSLPYSAAAIMWAALVGKDDLVCKGNSVLEVILTPDAIGRVLNQLELLKFDFATERQPAALIHDLEQFVASNQHGLFELVDTDLDAISPAIQASCAPAPLQFMEDLSLQHVRKPSGSMSRMALMENWMAPRMRRDDRYAPVGQCMRFIRMLNTHARQSEPDIRAELAEAQPDTALVDIMVLEALSQRLRTFQCPVFMIPLSYASLGTFSVERQKSFSIVSKYDVSDEHSRAVLRLQCFLEYAKPYTWVHKVTCHLATNEQAFHDTQRLAQHFTMETHLNTITMDSLNDRLKQCATFCDVPTNAKKAGKERTRMVLAQQVPQVPSTTFSVASGSAVTKPAAVQHSSAIRRFMQSIEVLNLEAEIRTKLLVDPPDARFIITRVLRFRNPILSQLVLGCAGRHTVPGDDVWEQVQPLAVHGKDVLAFSLTADTDANSIMVQPDDLKIFSTKLSEASFKAMVHLKLNSPTASLHKLAFTIRNILSDSTRDRTPHAAILYGDHSCNAASMKYGDRLAYFLGWKNGVYTAFMDPIQDILLEAPDAEQDDFRDIQEACTEVVILGHAEMHKHFEIFLTTDSPLVSFPFGGKLLVSPTGEYQAALAKLKKDVKNPHSSVFKRRIANLKALRSIPAKMQQLDGMMRQTEQRLRQHSKHTPRYDAGPTSPHTTSTQPDLGEALGRLSEGYFPQPTWSLLQDDGSMVIGSSKTVRVDVDEMCSDLSVQRSAICPTLVVLDPGCTLESCQSKCPTPHIPGHRHINDFAHAKSVALRTDYSQIRDKVTSRVPTQLALSLAKDSSSSTGQQSQASSKGAGRGRGRSRGTGRRGAGRGSFKKRKLSATEQHRTAGFPSNEEGDGPLPSGSP